MTERIVMQWLRPHLQAERWALEALREHAKEIRELTQPHWGCEMQSHGVCDACETYREYLAMLACDSWEIQENVRGPVALMTSCRGK